MPLSSFSVIITCILEPYLGCHYPIGDFNASLEMFLKLLDFESYSEFEIPQV